MLRRIAGVFVGVSVAACGAMAEPFSTKVVPAEAKWVLHVDVDALVNGPAWPIIEDKLAAGHIQAKIADFETIAGIQLPQDLHSVTVFGTGFEAPDGVMIFRARVDQNQLRNLLQMNPSYASTAHGENDILQWEDKGNIMHGAFFGADQVIIGRNEDNIALALDSLSGKGKTMPESSYMAGGKSSGVTVLLASDSVAQLAKRDPRNPVLKKITAAWITLAAEGDNLALRSQLNCGSDSAATQMKDIVEGLKAAAPLLAEAQNADARMKTLAPLLPGLQVSAKGADLRLEWTVPFEQAKTTLLQFAAAKQQNKSQIMKQTQDQKKK